MEQGTNSGRLFGLVLVAIICMVAFGDLDPLDSVRATDPSGASDSSTVAETKPASAVRAPQAKRSERLAHERLASLVEAASAKADPIPWNSPSIPSRDAAPAPAPKQVAPKTDLQVAKGAGEKWDAAGDEPLFTTEPVPDFPNTSKDTIQDKPLPRPVIREWVPASIAGRLLLDPGIPGGVLRVELEELLPTGGAMGRMHPAKTPNPNGEFHFDNIAPGLIAIRVSLWGTKRSLAWVDEIELEEGEHRDQASACEVSLVGRLFSREVEVLDVFGLRIEPAVVYPGSSRDRSYGTPRVQLEGETPVIWMDEDGMMLTVLAADHAPSSVTADPKDVDSALPLRVALVHQKATALELRFLDQELLEGLPPGFVLRAELRRTNGLEFPWDESRHQGEFDAAGRLRLEPADCGKFGVHLLLVSPAGETRPLDRQPELVEVSPSNSEGKGAIQVVHLRGFSSSLGVSK